MKFVELTEKEYKKFLDNHEQKTFLHSPNIGKMRHVDGWNYIFLGIKDNSKIIGATMLLSRKEFLGKKEFYAPRGFLIDYNNFELLSFFTKNIKKYVKDNNGFILRIDPYVIKQERDINGEIVKGGVNNFEAIKNLTRLCFKEKKSEQAKWMFVLNTKNKSIDELMKDMKPNTRNCINRTFKNGINIRELNYDELELFYQVTNDTSERKGFANKSLGYYQQMYKLFKPNNEVKFLVAELNTKEYKENLEIQINKETEILNRIKDKNSGKYKEQEIKVKGIQKNLNESNTLIEKGDVITLSAAMFLMYGEEVIYLSSGNYQEYFNFFAQYRIQYEMIKYAAENGYSLYNFYTISEHFDKNDERYGVYEFKKGFNGYVIELIGEYKLNINHSICFCYDLVNSIKKIVKNLVRKK